MYYRVLVASQRFHGQESLTYSSANKLQVGQIVEVPLQNRKALGIIESATSKPSFTSKPILQDWPFQIPTASLSLLTWLQNYYPAPLGLLTSLFVPTNLPKKVEVPRLKSAPQPITLPPLTDEQQAALQILRQHPKESVLLHGDTGTGKTRLYFELAQAALAQGRSVIILTPEIGLTEPLIESLQASLTQPVIVTHSAMTPAQRRKVWLACAAAQEPLVVIGPRSALFSPLHNVGLIVMDEAHDGAYKQEQLPRYQTSRVAAQLAKLHNAQLVMGSATPAVVDYFAFEQKGLPIVRMTKPAIQTSHALSQVLIDLKDKSQFNRSAWLSEPLLEAISTGLKRGEQSLLFLNRRGTARLILCEVCGWQALCPHCDVALTYHQDQFIMRCHSCDFRAAVPQTCPVCQAEQLVFRSIGTKALELELARLYPKAHIARFDRDTVQDLRLEHQYAAIKAGHVNLLVGTQTIAKGLDLPHLSTVGVIQADSGLQIPDYSATERTYQLISQVSGRIGRGHLGGKLFIQTYQPRSSLFEQALKKDYASFYQQELKERQLFRFPPYYFLLKLTCLRASRKNAISACEKLVAQIKLTWPTGVIVEGPAPRFIEKEAGRYGWHLLIKTRQRERLVDIVCNLPAGVSFDLDPTDIL